VLEVKAIAEGKELELQKQLSATHSKVDELSNQVKSVNDKLDVAVKGQEAARTELAKSQMQIERADSATEKAELRNKELSDEVKEIKKLLLAAEAKISKAEARVNTVEAVSEEQAKTIKRLDVKQQDLTTLADIQNKYEKLQGEYQSVSRSEAVASEQQKSIARIEKEYSDLNIKYDKAIRAEASSAAKLEMLQGEKKAKESQIKV
jgi:chromosome segregation ATPase